MFSKILQKKLLKIQKQYAFMKPAKFVVHFLCMFHYFIFLFVFYFIMKLCTNAGHNTYAMAVESL